MPKRAKGNAPRRRRPAVAFDELHGRAALVTGAGVRIGAAVARRLAASGVDVVIHHHKSAGAARGLADEIRGTGVRAATVAADLSVAADRKGLVAAAAKAIGRPLDLLVNNASSYPARRLPDLTWKNLEADLAVNAWAPLELTLAFAKQVPRGVVGHVVNFLDARIVDDDRGHAGYFLAKRLLTDLTRLCALELAPGICVNAVAPGPTLAAPGTAAGQGNAMLERLRQRLPLKRNPTADDLARAVIYLAGSRAHTGQILFVDGGRHLGRPHE